MTSSFENSAMKSSFSLSSLRSAQAQNSGPREQLERPYHSLTKKRKEPCREAWRRSWGSAASGGSSGDGLWPLLQHHYENIIMDNQIIDSCKEANGELLSINSSVLHGCPRLLNPTAGFNRQWSLNQLIAEFEELCQWLTHVQEEIYSSPENLSNRKLRMTRMTELLSVESRRVKFIEQANAILDRIPEASADVTWRMEHLDVKWEGLRLLLSPEQQNRDGNNSDTVDTTAHELRCLRRWLHCMEGRLPPPSLAAARSATYHELLRKLREHKVLQKDVECHRRIVSSVVRLCSGGDAAKALERRWHLLYLRAIEWQCHLEACIARLDNQGVQSVEAASDSDDEPVLKQPRLSSRGSPRRQRTPVNSRQRDLSCDSRQSASEEEQEYALTYKWRGFGSDCEFESDRPERKMADERRVPCDDDMAARNTDQTVPVTDQIDGLEMNNAMKMEEKTKTPPTVIKRKKPVDKSKFNQTDRKSNHLAIFYFKHHDTDSDRQVVETDEKTQSESSEEEWTYVGTAKIGNEDSTDLMTSSVEIQGELPADDKSDKKSVSPKPKLDASTPDLLKVDTRCKDLERLVNQAEELVQKQAQHHIIMKKKSRSFKPLAFEEESQNVSRNKMSRIKEWLNQSNDGKDQDNQGTENYDASGEYTTESEVDTSLTSEERNIHSSMDMSTSTCTVTPTHQAKVTLRKKRAGNSARPWSVSCLSQLSAGASLAATPTAGDVAAMSHNMSISESALNTLASPQRVTPSNSNSKLRGSSTTVQGHVSSTNTMTEACTSCVEANDKQCWLRRKRNKLRVRRTHVDTRERLVKSLSFCGRMTPEREEKHERSTASDPATSRKSRFDTTSTSGNDSDEDQIKQQLATIANLRKSIEKTHITSRDENTIPENGTVTPSFKLGLAGGPVRPRLARSVERERTFLALSLGDPNQMYDLSVDKDSDVDRSVTAGTEEHSSFSEQAWDFYQEKYNSEPYSEAPDSDAARRLLEFGDDYRAFLDSQSDCCSSLSAQPENDSPNGTRRRKPDTRERSLPRYKRPTRTSPVETPSRKPKKSMSSAERKKTLLDSLERSRNNTSIESNDGRRRRPSETSKNSKRSPEFDLLNVQALSRRRHNSNMTSDEVNSSLEYTEVNNRPDILDSLNRRRRENGSELQKIALTELRRRSTESVDSEDESSSPKKHSRRNWDSDSESEEIRSLVRRSSVQLEAAEKLMESEMSLDLLNGFDYTELVTRCRENINLLDAALSGGLSTTLQRDVRAVSARWSALRAAATRRGGARRLRRELIALREALDDVCEPGDCASQPHTKTQLHRRIEELKERLSRLLEWKVSMLKLTVSVRRALGDTEGDDTGLAADLATLLATWDEAHQRTSNELIALEKAVSAWTEWEAALRELQSALRGDLATLESLRDRGTNVGDQTEVAAQIKQLAASLVDKKKGSSTCDSLSDSGISDGDSEGAGRRAKRLSALRELARRLQAALAPNSPAHRTIVKRMEQTENEVRSLQESCRALVEQNIPDLKLDEADHTIAAVTGNKTGAGDPDYSPRGGWLWRVLRSSLPIQLCLVALLLAAWLVERPRCCDALNSLAQTLTPQLRYVRGPPPV